MASPTDTDRIELDSIDLSNRDLFRKGVPHGLFAQLRREAPVWRHPETPGVRTLVDRPLWVVSTHEELRAVSRDAATFSAYDGPSIPLQAPSASGQRWEGLSLVSTDGEAHSRLRNLINRGFTPRMIAKLEERIATWSTRIVDAVLERGECNFVSDVAKALPMQLFADILGIPERERDHIFELVDSFMSAGDPTLPITPERKQRIDQELFDYGMRLSKARRASPEDDVWSKIACAEIEGPDGEKTRLSDWELQIFFVVLLTAGSETTQNAIAEGILTFLDHPEQLEHFRSDPSVRETAAQEIIRWTSPLRYWARTATRDAELSGVRIGEGDRVSVWFGSANRDEGVFDDGDRFDVTRSPNPHCAFGGGGQHYCLGSHLAAREVRVIFEALFERVADFELLDTPKWSVAGLQNNITCSLHHIPLRLRPS